MDILFRWLIPSTITLTTLINVGYIQLPYYCSDEVTTVSEPGPDTTVSPLSADSTPHPSRSCVWMPTEIRCTLKDGFEIYAQRPVS